MNHVPIHFTLLLNVGLAMIPLLLAYYLFKKIERRNVLWWFFVMVFVAFLPNSAYVLTDVIHLLAAIESPNISRPYLYGILFPLFIVYFLVCFESYVLSVTWAKRYCQHQSWFSFASYIVPGLTALSALGVYLGRVQRLESTDILEHPITVLHDILLDLTQLKSLAMIALFFIGYLISYYLFNAVNRVIVNRYRERFEL
ncbi:DUF1361 domain-containing protein [Thalassotalea ganghwensis]